MLTGALLQPRPKTASFSRQAVVREQRQRRTVTPPTPPRRNTTQRSVPRLAAPRSALPRLASDRWLLIRCACVAVAVAVAVAFWSLPRSSIAEANHAHPVVKRLLWSARRPFFVWISQCPTPLHCTPSHPATRATSCATWNWLLISRLCHSQLPLEGSS